MGFGVVILLIIIGGISSYLDVTKLASYTYTLYDHPYTVGLAIRDAEISARTMLDVMHDITLATESGNTEKLRKKEIKDAQKQLFGLCKDIKGVIIQATLRR